MGLISRVSSRTYRSFKYTRDLKNMTDHVNESTQLPPYLPQNLKQKDMIVPTTTRKLEQCRCRLSKVQTCLVKWFRIIKRGTVLVVAIRVNIFGLIKYCLFRCSSNLTEVEYTCM